MIRTLFFALLFSCALISDGRAQITEILNTPRATVNGKTAGVWSYRNGGLGWACFDVFRLEPDGWHAGFIVPNQCKSDEEFQAELDAAGGAAHWIDQHLPMINAGMARAVGSTVGMAPTDAGTPQANAINAALGGLFKFQTNADGSTVLVRK